VDVVVIDSVAALVPRAEIEGEMGDSHPGLQARLMSQALRKLSGAIKQSNTIMIFTNQLREKIGVMFGSPETTSGGRALKFYASVRLDVRRVTAIKAQGEVTGHRTRVRVTKNKVAPPFRVAEFDIMFGDGISREGDLMDVGLELDVIDKRGSFYYYDGERFAQGRENAKVYLKENPEFANTLEDLIRHKLAEMKDIPLEFGADVDMDDDGSALEDEA
jgi:recombination protein RecA